MSEVKWIKITTDIFDDEKFDAISSLADKQMIQLAWIKLLCLAGKCNDNGFLTISNEIPYTNEMLASRFNMSVGDVQRALVLFQELHMIEVVDNVYMISNWAKYQSVDDLDKIREKGKERTRRWREKQKALADKRKDECDVTRDVTRDVNCSISISNSISNSLEDKDIDNKQVIQDIVVYLNNKTGKKFKWQTESTRKHINARLEDGYTYEDFCKVIDNKCEAWLNDPRMNTYLRPDTLFTPSHFESYLNEKPQINTNEVVEEWANDES